MGLWSFLAIAVVASTLASMFGIYQKQNQKPSLDEDIFKIMKGEIQNLKERVANLEAIASSDLKEKSKSIWSDYQIDDPDQDNYSGGNRNKERN